MGLTHSKNEMNRQTSESIKAFGVKEAIQESQDIFKMRSLPIPTSEHDSSSPGEITCSISFSSEDGQRFVAFGCSKGVWIGLYDDPSSLRLAVHLNMVTNCAALEDFGFFLVLANKSLFAYRIETLVLSVTNLKAKTPEFQCLSGNNEVHFFTVGHLQGKTLVIYMKKEKRKCIFRALEPLNKRDVIENLKSRYLSEPFQVWFRIYRDFLPSSESFDLVFLQSAIGIVCTKGFEILDLDNFNSVIIPNGENAKFSRQFAACKPLSIFPCGDGRLLLVYSEFGVFADEQSNHSKLGSVIEWEGVAEHVALYDPYILLFSPHFIEVREMTSGRFMQIILGNNVRCIWDGRGAREQDASTNVHVAFEGLGRFVELGVEAQQILELVPTLEHTYAPN